MRLTPDETPGLTGSYHNYRFICRFALRTLVLLWVPRWDKAVLLNKRVWIAKRRACIVLSGLKDLIDWVCWQTYDGAQVDGLGFEPQCIRTWRVAQYKCTDKYKWGISIGETYVYLDHCGLQRIRNKLFEYHIVCVLLSLNHSSLRKFRVRFPFRSEK